MLKKIMVMTLMLLKTLIEEIKLVMVGLVVILVIYTIVANPFRPASIQQAIDLGFVKLTFEDHQDDGYYFRLSDNSDKQPYAAVGIPKITDGTSIEYTWSSVNGDNNKEYDFKYSKGAYVYESKVINDKISYEPISPSEDEWLESTYGYLYTNLVKEQETEYKPMINYSGSSDQCKNYHCYDFNTY